MTIDVAPSTWISGYASDGTNITIPIASLEGLTAGEANATTGDIRKLMLAFETTMFNTWDAKTQAAQPKEWTSALLVKSDDIARTASYKFTNTFQIKPLSIDVVNEP